jgi:thiol-disulfide isomerase/thioredoxin
MLNNRRYARLSLHQWLVGGLALMLSGCSAISAMFSDGMVKVDPSAAGGKGADVKPVRADLPDYGLAPEVTNTVWLNTEGEKRLTLTDLRGKVVLLNFWTFGCYNCKNILPYVRQWHDTYTADGLVVVGVHFPEFAYEADLNNLREATVNLGVVWPVAYDNDGTTWRAYRQRYWPTLYLIDKQGHLRYQRIGEGAYTQTEDAIKALLAETYP